VSAHAADRELFLLSRLADIGGPCGREALTLLTEWLFGYAATEVVEAPTDPANVAMRTVFQRAGWTLAGSLTEFGREWVLYRITRREWEAQ
jgi:RimJ/RimL family protein N-acetyltransferase